MCCFMVVLMIHLLQDKLYVTIFSHCFLKNQLPKIVVYILSGEVDFPTPAFSIA